MSAILEQISDALQASWPFMLTVVVVIVALWIIDHLIRRRAAKRTGESHFGRQIFMLLLTIIGLVIIILTVPAKDEIRTQLLGLLGVALTAVIALSSTTFVSNAMSGILLRSMSRFRPGDFVRVGDHLGRVTERGLFHTEVQSDDRDLITFPNFYLISNPLKVVRASGTIISAYVSLGYDVPNGTVRSVLTRAAESTGLKDTFSHVEELGDFSITYRVAGFLEDVKQLVSAPSKLRIAMIDALHEADIEIVSPTFMIQRRQELDQKMIATSDGNAAIDQVSNARGDVIFDKAEAAAQVTSLRAEQKTLDDEISQLKKDLGEADASVLPRLERDIRWREERLIAIDKLLEQAEQAHREHDH